MALDQLSVPPILERQGFRLAAAVVAAGGGVWAFKRWIPTPFQGLGRDVSAAGAKQPQQPHRDKASERLEWWQRIQDLKPVLTLPEPQQLAVALAESDQSSLRGADSVHELVTKVVQERLGRGKDWLVRDSDYVVKDGAVPAHVAVKAKVNPALVKLIAVVTKGQLIAQLASDPKSILLILDTPQYGTLRELVGQFPELRCSQQVVIPQADLAHYFEMTRGGEFYPGVRAQRLDHWLCANARLGLRCVAAFLDYECRLVGAMSAKLCPAADIMRYFRFGYPAEPLSVLAITVGLEDPAATPEMVDAFVRREAELNGYVAELQETWKYRMVTLLYVVRRSG